MGSRYDMENHLFEKGLTIREVNKIMNESKGKSKGKSKKRCEQKCKPASRTGLIHRKDKMDKSDRVYCEYCDKDISLAYYKSHLNTLNHLANVGRNMVEDEKKKEKTQVKKHKSKKYETEDTDEEKIEKGLSSESGTEDENSESSVDEEFQKN